jgi:hypothetical protein
MKCARSAKNNQITWLSVGYSKIGTEALKLMLTGGEPLAPEHVAAIRRVLAVRGIKTNGRKVKETN